MDIDKLPAKCPRCGHTIFKQKISIEGFANKLYGMSNLSISLDHPVMVVENGLSDNDFYNDIVCNACGTTIIEAGVHKQ